MCSQFPTEASIRKGEIEVQHNIPSSGALNLAPDTGDGKKSEIVNRLNESSIVFGQHYPLLHLLL